MKHVQLITLLLAAGLAACSSDDGTETPPAPRSMTVEVTENPFIDSETGSRISLSPLRKAAATTTSTLGSFSMSYTGLYKYDFTKANGKWGPTTYSWPVENESAAIDFYAYTNNTGVTFDYNNDNPYITFTVDELAPNQHDLLVAHTQTSFTTSKGKVSLEFDHACAAVQFYIGQSNALSQKGLVYSSIALSGVYDTGEYHYNVNETPDWKELSGNATYTLESSSNILIPITPTTNEGADKLSCDHLFMIPQNHSNAKIIIKFSRPNSTDTETAEISLGDINWQAGYEYTVKVRLGTTYFEKPQEPETES